jgi:hypothetical protein
MIERVDSGKVEAIISEIQLRIPAQEVGSHSQFTYEQTLIIATTAAEIAFRMAAMPSEDASEAARYIRYEDDVEVTGVPPMIISLRGEQ